MKKIYNWVSKYIDTIYAPYILALLVFIEGFFLMPSSTLLSFYCLNNRKKSLLYGTIATISAILSAIFGYFLGLLILKYNIDHWLYYLISKKKLDYIISMYKQYNAWFIYSSIILPIPFKIITLVAGYSKLNFFNFIISTSISRAIKFYAISIGIYIFGERLMYFLNKYFYYIIFSFILLISLIFAIKYFNLFDKIIKSFNIF